MIQDVTRALSKSRSADWVVVVSQSRRVLQHARRQGWVTLCEYEQISHSHSVDCAASILRQKGVTTLLQIPCDIPLLEAADVDNLLKTELVEPAVVLVPSQDRQGTNALLRTPPDLFSSQFGENSFVLHQEIAREAGAAVSIVENPRIALDLDEPSDLLEFYKIGSHTSTYQVINEMGLHEGLCTKSCSTGPELK